MTTEAIEAVLAELDALHSSPVDPQLAAVRTALLVEDALGIVLSDDEIDPSALGDQSAIRQLIARHRI